MQWCRKREGAGAAIDSTALQQVNVPSTALSNTCCALLPVLRLLLSYDCFNQLHINITAVCVDCSEITLKRH